jgi:DNA-binding NarL/FixJ family response regulator
MTTLRVVIADDHPVVRRGLCELLGSLEDMEVVGVASTGREAVHQVVTCKPDVALLDLQMPELDGVAAAAELARVAPKVAVLVLTMFNDEDKLVAALRAGARGYVVKGAEQEEIAGAIRAVAAGQLVVGAGVSAAAIGLVLRAAVEPRQAFPQLTARELAVLELMADGRSNAAIARELGLAAKTVANNVSHILVKLGARDRTAVILEARSAGLGQS